ncbi:MAG: DUF4062 domain-containing protein [Chitinophagaceae bacterium]
MKKKVYISSTLDLPEYRKAIEDTFKKQGKFFELVRIAEYMTASTKTALEECLTDVECCDLYVLIIGYRYGTIVPGEGISFTHCEYRRAFEQCNPPKEIVVFYAAEGIEALPHEKDNIDKFRDFKKMLSNTHLSSITGFKDPQHLVTQLQDALLLRIFENLPTLQNDAIEYKCNRTENVAAYKNQVLNVSLQADNVLSSVLYGKENDKPRSFTGRLVKMEYNLQSKLSLTRSLFIDSMSQVKCMMNLLRNIYEQLFPEDKNYYRDRELIMNFRNVSSFFKLLEVKGFKEIFIEFVLDILELDNKLMIETLQEFILELEEDAPESIFIHTAFCITGNKPFQEISDAYSVFTSQFNHLVDISYLKLVSRKDIYSWIETELKEPNPAKINRLIDKYFDRSDFGISMSEAQEKLQNLVNELYFNLVP